MEFIRGLELKLKDVNLILELAQKKAILGEIILFLNVKILNLIKKIILLNFTHR